MRVLVYGLIGTNRGGIETYLLKMNSHMSEDTIFDYVVEGNQCIHMDEIRKKGGKVYYVTRKKASLLKNIRDNWRIQRKLKNEIHTVYFNLSSLSWIMPVLTARLNGYHVCVHSHNAQYIEANRDWLHRIVNQINKFVISKLRLYRMTCSLPAREFMFRQADDVTMIYNAIEADKFKFDEDMRRSVREELGIDSERIIGFVGRINDQKNPLYLPCIMKAVCELRKDVRMLLLGDGPLMGDLKKKAEKLGVAGRMHFMGNQTNVGAYMNAMDVLVLPSMHEGLPFALVEAQAAGLFCFTSEFVTREVDLTGNIRFLKLEADAKNWGMEIHRYFERNEEKLRTETYDLLIRSDFNIDIEAKKLETILKKMNGSRWENKLHVFKKN